jgi:hypothetical protein
MWYNESPNPLWSSFFSDANMNQLQSQIKQNVRSQTSYQIGDQNPNDLFTLMGKIYTDMRADPNSDVQNQVSAMNRATVDAASTTIKTGILQQLGYLRDIARNPIPPPVPASTSSFGMSLSRPI